MFLNVGEDKVSSWFLVLVQMKACKSCVCVSLFRVYTVRVRWWAWPQLTQDLQRLHQGHFSRLFLELQKLTL